jgi:hypothetical protein
MPVLRVKPGYRHLVQKRNFCGPACIQMALFRKGKWVDQETLAYDLGVKVDEKDKGIYTLPFKTLKSNDPRIGIVIADFRNERIIKDLRKCGIVPEVFLISEIESPEDFLEGKIKEGNDIIVNFWWKPINGIEFGHFVLLSEYDTDRKELTVCDPNPGGRSFWKVGLDKILEGMSPEFTGKERGFVIIKQIE